MVNINIPDYMLWISLGAIIIVPTLYFLIVLLIRKIKQRPVISQRPIVPDESLQESLKTLSIERKAEKKLTVKEKHIEEKAIPKKELKTGKFYYEVVPFEYFDRSKLSIRYWRDRRTAKKHPQKVVLVRFEMNNGRHREFIVKEKADGFVYNNEKYIFDIENKYYIVDSNIWAYDFHEGFALPVKNKLILNPDLEKIFDKIEKESRKGIKRKIPSDLLKETIEESGITQIENAVNPKILERVSESQFVQMILQGATLGKLFKVLLILVIIALIGIVADLVIDFISSGLIDEVGLGNLGGK